MTGGSRRGSWSGTPPETPNAGFFGGIVAIVRLGMFALLFLGVFNAVSNVFRSRVVGQTVGASTSTARIALTTIAASAVLMLVLALNVASPLRRLLSGRLATWLSAGSAATAVGGVAIALVGGTRLAIAALVIVLLPGAAFLVVLVLSRASQMPPSAAPSRSRPSRAAQSPTEDAPQGSAAPRRRRSGGKR